MDDPITDVVVVTSTSDCPHGYTIIKTTPCGFSANLWEKVFGGRSGERYICFTKRGGQNDTVVEDMIIPPPSQKYLRKGYRAISDTPDGEEPLRHKQLVLKRTNRSECSEAIVDIVVYRSNDEPAHNFRKVAKVNDLYICVRPSKISPTSSNTASKPEPAVKIAPVQEKVNLEPVVESIPNVDALLDRMDNASISPGGYGPTEHRASPQDTNLQYSTTTTAYPQTITTQSMPEPTSTYSSSQTTSSYSMPGTSGYASSNTQGATTYTGSGYSGSQTTSSYSIPNTGGYTSSGTQGATAYPEYTYSSSQTTRSTYSMPSYTSNTQGATTYPGSGYSSSSYSNSGTPYSSSNTGYSNPSAQYSGTYSSGQYPSANSQYSNTAYPQSTQYSSNPYSNASYSNPGNSYANAGYLGASYGSSLPYSTNPTAGAYSNQQYPSTAGYSTQPTANAYPSQQYPTTYQPGGYPQAPPTNQGYAPTGGSYGGNQSAYPPTTKHFSDDIGFGF